MSCLYIVSPSSLYVYYTISVSNISCSGMQAYMQLIMKKVYYGFLKFYSAGYDVIKLFTSVIYKVSK
jgi:hypothetical protein